MEDTSVSYLPGSMEILNAMLAWKKDVSNNNNKNNSNKKNDGKNNCILQY